MEPNKAENEGNKAEQVSSLGTVEADNGPNGPVETQTNEGDQTWGNTPEEDMESISDLTDQDMLEFIPITQSNQTGKIEGETSLDPRGDSPGVN